MQFLAKVQGIFLIFAAYFLAVLEILKTRKALTDFLEYQRAKQPSVGLVPTMGALHEGHLSLIRRCARENDLSVCSIFVNPTQFNDPKDLEKYPRPREHDIEKLRGTDCDALFMPDEREIYPEQEEWHLELGELEHVLEGKFRPGHYQGVTQVVWKLFDLVKPSRAYFGQKDYQQFLVIRKMVELLSVPVELVCCPTEREADGLAMSSRNVHLSPEERKEATLLSRALFRIRDEASFRSPAEARRAALELLLVSPLIEVEYLEIVDAGNLRPLDHWQDAVSSIALGAIRLGQTRLIDNLFIQ